MDFRIKNLKSFEPLHRNQFDPLVTVLRELNKTLIQTKQVLMETKQVLVQTKKQKQTTNQVILQFKRYLEQKESKNQLTATKYTDGQRQKQNKNDKEILCETENKRKANISGEQNNLTPFDRQELQQIVLCPKETRKMQIKIRPKIIKKQVKKRQSMIKSYIAKIASEVFSVSFNLFYKQKLDFEKVKGYCSENLLANMVEFFQREAIGVQQLKGIDNHLSNQVLPFLKLSYPHSEEREISLKLSNRISQKDILNQNRFDVIFNSPIKKMSWYDLPASDQNDKNNKTFREVMEVINYLIQLPDQNIGKTQDSKTYFQKFQEDMRACFSIIENDHLTKALTKKEFDTKQLSLNIPQVDDCIDLIEKLKSQIAINIKKDEREELEYIEKVKSYTKWKIGRKISPNTPLYSKGEIEKGEINVKNSSIRRILSKWIESLQLYFENPAEATILRDQFLLSMSGEENTYQTAEDKEALFTFFLNKSLTVLKNEEEIRKNNYQIMGEAIDNKKGIFSSEYCSQRQANVANFSMIMSLASENYILKYLKLLINSIKQIQIQYFNWFYDKPMAERQPLFINLKLGDLMRCQLSSRENQVIAIYQYLMLLCERSPKKFELVRVKNRFNGPNKDILINIWYYEKIMIEIQLAIKNQSSFLECSDKFSHFIYELRREVLGPINELANVWKKFNPKVQFLERKYEQNIQEGFENMHRARCKQQDHFYLVVEANLPFWCKDCQRFQHLQINSWKCIYCDIVICRKCKNYIDVIKAHPTRRAIKKMIFKKGEVMKGVQIETGIFRYYYLIQIMGKYRVYSFLLDQSREKSTKEDNKIKGLKQEFKININNYQGKRIKSFENHHYLYGKQQGIDPQKVLKQIIIKFWEDQFKAILKKRNKAFSIMFPTSPEINWHDKKPIVLSTVTRVFQNKETQFIEKLNIQKSWLDDLSFLSQFRKIKQANFSFNKIKEMGQLIFQHLEDLRLKKNEISSLQLCPSMQALKRLDLQENMLQSLKGLPRLASLKTLKMNKNKLKSFEGLPELPQLEFLQLDENNLKTLDHLKKLPKLKTLLIDYNEIDTLSGFADLPSLQKVCASKNRIVSLREISQLKKLKQIKVRQNKIQSLKDLQFSQSIEIIDLYCNSLKSLEGAEKFINLRTLLANKNGIQNCTFANLSQLHQLQTLNLNENSISSLTDFPYCPLLKDLSLSFNQISSLSGICKFNHLKKLNLQNNKIASLSELPDLSNLVELKLNFNQIKSVQRAPQMKSLEHLHLNYNQISNLKGFPKNLKHLTIISNQISTFSQMTQMRYLQSLNLEENSLSSFEGFISLQNLQKLILNCNEIASFNHFPYLPFLKILQMQENGISSFEGLPRLPNLSFLGLYGNRIQNFRYLPQLESVQRADLSTNCIDSLIGLNNLPALNFLKIGFNKIQDLSGMQKLFSLESIFLTSNKITNMKTFPYLPNLKQVYLDRNQINTLQIIQKVSVNKLNLSYNKLVSMAGIKSYLNLQDVNLSDNQIQNLMLTPDLLDIQKLDISNNKVKKLGQFCKLRNLSQLVLVGNQIDIHDIELLEQLPSFNLVRINYQMIQQLAASRITDRVHFNITA